MYHSRENLLQNTLLVKMFCETLSPTKALCSGKGYPGKRIAKHFLRSKCASQNCTKNLTHPTSLTSALRYFGQCGLFGSPSLHTAKPSQIKNYPKLKNSPDEFFAFSSHFILFQVLPYVLGLIKKTQNCCQACDYTSKLIQWALSSCRELQHLKTDFRQGIYHDTAACILRFPQHPTITVLHSQRITA